MSDLSHRCGVCNAEIAREPPRLLIRDRRRALKGTWNVFECRRCRTLTIAPFPSQSQLRESYSAYASNQPIVFSESIGSRYPLLRRLYHWASGDVDPRDFVEIPEGARVLDYGCGHASYLVDFHRRGIRISGAEIAADVVDACRASGFDVRRIEDLDRIPFRNDEFDVVYLMQVFEHMREPHVVMRELARVLEPGGMLYLAVPNKASLWRTIFAENWVSGWFPPFHLFHYDRKALAHLAEQHGFVLITSWSRTPEHWFRLNLKAALYPKENRLDWHSSWIDTPFVRYLMMFALRVLELPVREKDCLVIKFQKKSS